MRETNSRTEVRGSAQLVGEKVVERLQLAALTQKEGVLRLESTGPLLGESPHLDPLRGPDDRAEEPREIELRVGDHLPRSRPEDRGERLLLPVGSEDDAGRVVGRARVEPGRVGVPAEDQVTDGRVRKGIARAAWLDEGDAPVARRVQQGPDLLVEEGLHALEADAERAGLHRALSTTPDRPRRPRSTPSSPLPGRTAMRTSAR